MDVFICFKPIGNDTGKGVGQTVAVNLSDLTYRIKSGYNVTLREKNPLRYVT